MNKTYRKLLASALIASQALVPTYASSTEAKFFFRFANNLDKFSVPEPGDNVGETEVDGFIPEVRMNALQGNVSSELSSGNPLPVLASIRKNLVGGESSVVFDTAYPSIPGLSFNAATGVLSGTPEAEFSGTVFLTYHDAANRRGKISVPLSIFPYPRLLSDHDTYDLPQNSNAIAHDIHVEPANDGFFNGVNYSISSGSLPEGLSLSEDGAILGKTLASVGPYQFTLRASNPTDPAVFAEKSITINVTAPAPMSLDLKPDAQLIWQLSEDTNTVVAQDLFSPVPTPKGSFTGPLSWSLLDAPEWMSIDNDGQLRGAPPAKGTFTARVVVTDADQSVAYDDISVKVVKAGHIFLEPGIQQISARVNETFATSPQLVTNAVGDHAISTELLPSNVTVDPITGVSTGKFTEAGGYFWRLRAIDEEGRRDANGLLAGTNYLQIIDVVPPVELAAAISASGGVQGRDDAPFNIRWDAPRNIIGEAEYSIIGDVPGTLYYKKYENNDPTKAATYIVARGADSGMEIKQATNETAADVESKLAADRIVFDTVSLTLKGVPHRSGTFEVALHVEDNHRNTGYTVNPSDEGRATSNSATSPSTSVIVHGTSYIAYVSNGGSETLSLRTSQPTIYTALRDSLSNKSHKNGATWTLASGQLPPGVTTRISDDTDVLTYVGYPTQEGTWSNITWSVTDSSGKTIVTSPVSFNVGPRQQLALTATPSSTIFLRAHGDDVDLSIAASNLPDNLPLSNGDWIINGDLPAGIHYAVDDNGLRFTGKATLAGTYDVTVTANDILGGQASLGVKMQVGSPFSAVNVGGSDQQLSQFTTQTTLGTVLRDAASNEHYSPEDAAWTLTSGTLPPGITTQVSEDGSSLQYVGYATEQGTWDNIAWTVTDKAGNSIVTPPVSFTVGPRGALEINTEPSESVNLRAGDDTTVIVKAINLPYGQQLTADDWVMTGTLPEGMTSTIVNNQIIISGTPLVAGTYDLSFSTTDSLGSTASKNMRLKVLSGLSIINFGGSTQDLAQFTAAPTLNSGVRISQSNEAYSDGDLTWELVSGTLPPGITTQVSGNTSVLQYVGYPTEQGTWDNIVWSATNADGNMVLTPAATFNVGPRQAVALTVDPADTVYAGSGENVSLTVSTENTAYGQKLTDNEWTVIGNLPAGVSYSVNNGSLVFSGTATQKGQFPVTVSATDALGSTGSTNLTFDISASFFAKNVSGNEAVLSQYTSNTSLATAIRLHRSNEAYVGTLTWEMESGTLPPGITTEISSGTDVLRYVGYPTEQGTWDSIVWKVTDADGNEVLTPPLSMTVGPRSDLELEASNNGVVNVDNGENVSLTVNASNIAFGSLSASDWTVTGDLPEGVSYSAQNNVLTFTGTPLKTGRYEVTVSAADGQSGAASKTVIFNVSSFMNTLQFGGLDQQLSQFTSLPTASVWARVRKSNEAYHDATWEMVSGTLPPGISSSIEGNGSRVAYTGYPSEQGTWDNIVWKITDPDGNFILSEPVSFTVGPRASLELSSNRTNNSYSTRTGIAIGANDLTVSARNLPFGTAPTGSNWTVTGLPDGVSYSVNNGVLQFTGAPTTSGEYSINVTAVDSLGGSASTVITFKVGVNLNALYFAGTEQTLMQYVDQPTLWANIRVAASNTAYRGGAEFSVVSGTLPEGVTLSSAADGSHVTFAGYPIETGTFENIVIGVTDPYGNVFNTRPFTLNVVDRSQLTLTAMPGTTRTLVQNTDEALLTVTPGNLAFGTPIPDSDWTVTGTLPPGLTYAATTEGLRFSGKATSAGTYNVSVSGVDSTASSASIDLVFKVTTATPTFNLTNYGLNDAVVNTQNVMFGSAPTLTTQAKLKSNGSLHTGIVSWSLASGRLPAGITPVISADKSTISYAGGPTEMGTFENIVWTATDASGAQVSTAPISFIVNGPITQLSANWYSTCGVTSDGAAKCWGESTTIGDGGSSNRNVPTQVSGLTSDVQQIATGKNHSCALMANGTVKCWGYNGLGQIGLGVSNTTTYRTPQNAVAFGSNNAMVATGDSVTCVVKNTGAAQCVGANNHGQIGIGTTTASQVTPATPTGLSTGVAKIVAGTNTTCAVMNDGTAKCWGSNRWGQVGSGDTVTKTVPTTIAGLAGVKNIASHGYLTDYGTTCAATTSGIYCWGMGRYGQIGDNNTANRNVPAAVPGMENAIDVQAGVTHVCGQKADKTIWCWGGNSQGRLGDGTMTDRRTITIPVVDLSPVETFAGGGDHTCATNADGLTKCWGSNDRGALGDGTSIHRSNAVPIAY